MAALIKKIKEVVVSLDRDTVARASRRLRLRIEVVITTDGDFIELNHSRYIPLLYFFTLETNFSSSALIPYCSVKKLFLAVEKILRIS